MANELAISDQIIINKIYLNRGQKVMLDRGLAELYGVETKQLKRQVRRNIERFPDDFMFEMNGKEFQNWRSQIGTSNFSDKMGLRYPPMCFTELGIAMLSSVLNTKQAIAVNIRIMGIFTRTRELLSTHKDILLKLEQLEMKVNKHDGDFQKVFDALKHFINTSNQPQKRIGYKKDIIR